jgi:hypothetical protein
MDGRALAELHDLCSRDEELASAVARLRELETAVTQTRARAAAIDAFFAAYPAEESRAIAAVHSAAADLERRRDELAASEDDLASARNNEERDLAEKAFGRARDHVAVAEAGLLRAQTACEEHQRDAAELPTELSRLEAEARKISSSAPDLPTPGVGAGALGAWASHAHAELFVGLSQLASQRERIIREANELASMLLGESTYGSTVAQTLRQVEARATAR